MSLQQVTDATFDQEVNHSDVPFWLILGRLVWSLQNDHPVLEDFSNDVSGN